MMESKSYDNPRELTSSDVSLLKLYSCPGVKQIKMRLFCVRNLVELAAFKY